MDTKSKKSKALIVWLCFFLGLNIVAVILVGSFSTVKDIGYTETVNSIKDVFKEDTKDTRNFKHKITIKFDSLAKALTDAQYLTKKYLPVEGSFTDYYELTDSALQNEYSNDGKYISKLEIIERGLYSEGENLIYYAENLKTGIKLTNSKTNLGISEKGFPTVPRGYNYYLYFNGEVFLIENAGEKSDIYDNDETGYWNLWFWGYSSEDINNKTPELKECRIFLIVKEDLIKNNGSLYQLKKRAQMGKLILLAIGLAFILAIALLIISIINRDIKHKFDKKIAIFLGKFWIEAKVLVSLFVCTFTFAVVGGSSHKIENFMYYVFSIAIIGWWSYLLFVDLIINKTSFFTNNSINSFIKIYRSFENKKTFQKGMVLRLYVLILVESILILLVGISSTAIVGGASGSGFYLFLFLICIITGAYLIYRYVRRYKQTILDIGTLVDGIETIKNGDVKTNLIINPSADMYEAAQSLKDIQKGIGKAVEDGIKSERTKVELITNVSHDLKTPLTSIISYADLLSKEEGLPQHVNDYIKIVQQKSDRLKTLIMDLFDLSKAASGEIGVDFEKLDLGKLVQQTLIDLEEDISKSGLIFKINIPKHPTFIISDGKKLYRIFVNLISNALKYSLVGSRVYIDLILEGNSENVVGNTSAKVTAIIKNIANYEMDFDENDILERFVRGDKARSSEGSGLGLAIAQNFTRVCGGKFDIAIDGDMFKVMLSFDIVL